MLGVDDAVLGVLGAGDDVLGVPGGGRALLPFFFFFLSLRVSLMAGFFLTSVWANGAPEQSIRCSSSSTSTGALPELAGGVSLTWQEHFPSSSTRLQAPMTSPLRWLPWGVRRISHSLVGDSISGYLSWPWGVNRGPVMLATVAITSANLFAIPR